MKQDLKHLTGRSFLPVAIAGLFALALLIVLVVFMFRQPGPVVPSPQEQAADFAKGLQYERGDSVTMDYGQALIWYRKAADAGYPPAELAIGTMTMAGRGVVKDEKGATVWFRRAAEHGLAEAQVQLAGDTLSGIATADGKPDKVEAMKWLLIGAENMPDPLGKQVAINTREALGREMTPQELGEAGKRAEDWKQQHAAPE